MVVAQVPIEHLLAGTRGTVFSMVLKGDTQGAYIRVSRLPWVSTVHVLQQNGRTAWQVSVTDEALAEAHLLSEVACHSGAVVTEFQRYKLSLEDVFVNLVEGGHRDH
jgi:hypothetical protein